MLWRGPFGGGAASGAQGSTVASHNRFGENLRARTTPVNPATSQQQAVRNAVKNYAGQYQATLTSAQRQAWQTYANNVTMLNKLGDAVQMTGINMFTRNNTPRQQASQTTILAAPTTMSLGTFTTPTIALGVATLNGTITYAAADPWVGTSSSVAGMLIYASRQQSPSINFFKGPYRFAAKVNGTSGSATFTLPFIAGPTTNQTFFQMRVAFSDGRLSSATATVGLSRLVRPRHRSPRW